MDKGSVELFGSLQTQFRVELSVDIATEQNADQDFQTAEYHLDILPIGSRDLERIC